MSASQAQESQVDTTRLKIGILRLKKFVAGILVLGIFLCLTTVIVAWFVAPWFVGFEFAGAALGGLAFGSLFLFSRTLIEVRSIVKSLENTTGIQPPKHQK